MLKQDFQIEKRKSIAHTEIILIILLNKSFFLIIIIFFPLHLAIIIYPNLNKKLA